ncbi:MAG: MBL fold metallo-hydrolase [Oscillospiraceae bacterium]
MTLYKTQLGPIQTNCYVLCDDAKNAAVIDPGADGNKVHALLQKHGLTPRLILLTHGHFDHIGGIMTLKKHWADLPVVMSEHDVPLLARAARLPAVSMYADPADYEGLTADRTVHEGDVVTVGDLSFTVMDTPGHTHGGICYLCGEYMFSGDTLFCLSVGRTDLEGGDYATLMRSIKRLAALKPNYIVLPGHDQSSTLDEERRCNPYMLEAVKCF